MTNKTKDNLFTLSIMLGLIFILIITAMILRWVAHPTDDFLGDFLTVRKIF